MNAVQLNYLKSNIASLEASTDLAVRARGVEAQFSGRCSPYLSHRTVEFASGPCRWGGAEIRNSWAHIILSPAEEDESSIAGHHFRNGDWIPVPYVSQRYGDNVICEAITVKVPASMLAGLREEVQLVGCDLPVEGVLDVRFWMPKLEGYDEDGSPIFVASKTDEEE